MAKQLSVINRLIGIGAWTLILLTTPSAFGEECPNLVNLERASIEQILEDPRYLDAIDDINYSFPSERVSYCLTRWGWVLGEKLYPTFETEESRELRLKLLSKIVQRKVELHQLLMASQNNMETRLRSQHLSSYIILLTNIDLYWNSTHNQNWSWDTLIDQSKVWLGLAGAIAVGTSYFSKPIGKTLKKTATKIFRDPKAKRVAANLTRNSRGVLAVQGAKTGARGTGAEASDGQAGLSKPPPDILDSPPPPFLELLNSEKHQHVLTPHLDWGQRDASSRYFDFLIQDISGEVLSLGFGIFLGYYLEAPISERLTSKFEKMEQKKIEKGPRGKRASSKIKKSLNFISKKGPGFWGKAAGFVGSFAVSIGATYGAKFGWDYFFINKRKKDYLNFQKKTFEFSESPLGKISNSLNHQGLQRLINLLNELAHIKLFPFQDLEASLTQKFVNQEEIPLMCKEDSMGHLEPIRESLDPEEVYFHLLDLELAKNFDSDFAETLIVTESSIQWIWDETSEVRNFIKSQDLPTEGLLIRQLDKIEKEAKEAINPETRLLRAAYQGSEALVETSRSYKKTKYVCGYYPYTGYTPHESLPYQRY